MFLKLTVNGLPIRINTEYIKKIEPSSIDKTHESVITLTKNKGEPELVGVDQSVDEIDKQLFPKKRGKTT